MIRCIPCSFVLLFFFYSCSTKEEKQQTTPVVDVTKSYPEKEIILQDVADVEYIPLETRNDVLLGQWGGFPYVSNDTIIAYNQGEQGDILVFDKQGRFVNKFNRKGQSGEEYTMLFNLIYFPEDKEFLVQGYPNNKNIQVYNTNGTYERTLKMPENKYWESVKRLNDSILLCYDGYSVSQYLGKKEVNLSPFILISRTDGSIIKNLPVDLKKRYSTFVKKTHFFAYHFMTPLIEAPEGIILNEISSDTLFYYTSEQQLAPCLIKSPSIDKMIKDEETYLDVLGTSKNYLFMSTSHKDLTKKQYYQKTNLLLDKRTNEIFQYKVVNADFPSNNESALYKNSFFQADKLIEALEKGKLSGKLKEIAEKLSPDDNPVLVKVKFK